MDSVRKLLDFVNFKLAVCVVLTATVLALAFSFVVPKKYKAWASIMVLEPLVARDLDPDYRKLEFAIETYSRVLRSSELLLKVILDLNLDMPPANMTIEKLSKLIKVKTVRDSQLIRIELQYIDPSLAAEIINRLADEFLKFHEALMAGEAESSQKFFRHQVEAAMEKLKESDKRLIEFQKQAQLDKLEARKQNCLERIGEFKKALAYNTIERAKVEKEIEQSKRELAALAKEQVTLRAHTFAAPSSEASLKQSLDTLESELASVDASEEEVKLVVGKLKYKVAQLKDKLQQNKNITLRELIELDMLIDRLPRESMSKSAPALMEAASGFQKVIVELNPVYQEIKRNLVSAQIWAAQVEGERKALSKALADAEREYEELNAKIARLSRKNDELWRNQDVYSEVYKQLKVRSEQMGLDVAAKIGDVVLVERAAVPSRPASPSPLKNAAAAFVLSALVAGGLLYLKSSYPEDRDEPESR
ncbi:MAG TPA: hypothetical protein ENF73_05970 [Proteobacteria bacterium]|nr:hypothetical protein [Pseudomonadota bacterium]